ncbi:hypothetical protein [Halomonas sp. KHS3]|uniref:hypothetical protein n=1 Tax=Halomonas sp. KHS3 TaxID=866350 RepID=UPI00059B340A|nr:hypothetical protein [Halomonas sp. KHS3]KIN13465.1 hypothetical protein RO22_19550 [Halomonas sp. KHS3]
MAENDTQKMLKAVLVLQAEILGRLDKLEKRSGNAMDNKMQERLGIISGAKVDTRVEVLAEVESLMGSQTGVQLSDAIAQLILKMDEENH